MRFAGDFFGVPLAKKEEGSALFEYFPELRAIPPKTSAASKGEARAVGGTKAVTPFTGYKTLEYKN